MPVSGSAITSAIIASAPTLLGPSFRGIAKAVGKSVATWIKIRTNVLVVGSTTGAAGAGNVTGKLFFLPTPSMNAAFSANGLLGVQAQPVATAIGTGILTSLNATAGYKGNSTGAIGADISKVVMANPATLVPILKANLGSQRLIGMTTSQLSSAIAAGTVGIVLTGTGTGVSVGGAGPAPSTGISSSKVF